MFCMLTFAMLTTSISVSSLPCSDFNENESYRAEAGKADPLAPVTVPPDTYGVVIQAAVGESPSQTIARKRGSGGSVPPARPIILASLGLPTPQDQNPASMDVGKAGHPDDQFDAGRGGPHVKIRTTSVHVEARDDKLSLLVVETPTNTFKTSVASDQANKFVCLLNAMIDEGYPIKDIGCYSYRYINTRYTGGAKMLSEHAKGRACDINQDERNVVTVRQPENTSDLAHKCGLFSGAEWASTPDRGHFEVLDKSTPAPPPVWPVTLASARAHQRYYQRRQTIQQPEVKIAVNWREDIH